MDLILSGSEESLLSSLDFSLPPTANFVQNRRLVSYYPSGASNFSPQGVRVARFNINGQSWLDPASMRITGTITNKSATTTLQLADGPHLLVQRMRVYMSGNCVEDIDFYGRSHQLFRRVLQNTNFIINDAVESGTQQYAEGQPGAVQPSLSNQVIAPGKSVQFNLTPLLGLLACGKMLPLRYGGLSLELTFADAESAVTTGSSTTYDIEGLSIRCAVSKLDSALEASYASLLMQNRALTIKLTSFSTLTSVLPAGSSEMDVSLVRAFSRLNALFITWQGSSAGDTPPANKHDGVSFLNPALFVVGGTTGAGVVCHDESKMSWDVQIGSLKWPETPCSSIPESFSLLRQACAVHDESLRTLSITPNSYKTTGFVVGVPLSTSPGAAFTGLNTRAGDLLTVRARGMQPDNTINGASGGRCYITMLHDVVIELREGSVSILD